MSGHLIDLDAAPFIPDGWELRDEDQLPNRARGAIDLVAAKPGLHLSKEQVRTGIVAGRALRAQLEDQPVLGTNVLYFLLANRHLIPESWKGKHVYFWGTVYRDGDGRLVVPCMVWLGFGWYGLSSRLSCYWSSDYPAAVLAGS